MDWKTFFDRLGLNGTRWQWRMMKWERNLRSLMQGNPTSMGWSATKILIGVNLLLFGLMVIFGAIGGLGLSGLLRPNSYLLIHFGAPAQSIDTQGLGESCPVADNQSDSGRERNRRVEIFAEVEDVL